MKKLWYSHGLPPWVKQNLRKMKLTVLFLCISAMASLANLSYAICNLTASKTCQR